MFLALHGQPSDVDAFEFELASHLHKTVGELSLMSYTEYTAWASYLKVKAAIAGTRG